MEIKMDNTKDQLEILQGRRMMVSREGRDEIGL
jgi:hypothetical protein